MRAPILILVLVCACTIDDRVVSGASTPAFPPGGAGASALGGGASTAMGEGPANRGEAPAGTNNPLLPGSVLTVDGGLSA